MARLTMILAVAALAGAVAPVAAQAQSAEAFYKGKQVRLVVGGSPGGGYDIFARRMVPYFTKYIPGNPSFVVENRQGGGGLLSSNFLYNTAPKDGSVIGMVERGAATDAVVNAALGFAKFDARKFNWIGSPSREVGITLVRQPSPLKTLDDFKTHQLIVSATNRTAGASVFPRILNAMFGTKFKVVDGYPSSGASLLAVESGEVEGHVATTASGLIRAQIAPWIKSGRVAVVLQLGLQKDEEYAHAEMITDLAKTDEDRAIFRLMLTQQQMAFPYLAPPDVPQDRVAALRKAFDASVADGDFKADAQKVGLQVVPVSGEEIHRLVDQLYQTPQPVIDRYNALAAG